SSIKLGLIVCAVLIVAAWRGRVEWRDRTLLLAASFALTPLIVFNQQVITGYSLQPLHYELFITKYLALLALVLTVSRLFERRETVRLKPRALLLACVCLVALAWGTVETGIETKRHAWADLDRDEALTVARRLAELSRASSQTFDTQSIILYFNLDAADISPVLAPQAVLWAPHTPAFSGLNLEENRERLYQYLYYTDEEMNLDEERFDSLDYRKKFLIHSLIEWGHNDAVWTVNWKRITPEDVHSALQAYARYRDSFSFNEATHPTLSYVVTDTASPDFKNLDRWYERDSGERVGRFTIYRVRLKGER
ncbi:MAG TPA: hypothetical protein VKB86_05830, partial [Pyrinomonadaceae bacterium]|nr:hypothetical protein [Pyrinomonadaceae bacterium]